MFDRQKKQVLERRDKSSKGSVDENIRDLVELINGLHDYYTSSSCSGRIFLIEVDPGNRKDLSRWTYLTHLRADFHEVKKALFSVGDKEVWFQQEPLIIHICCKDLDSAKKMLKACALAGIKRAGIIALGKRIMIEAIGNERIDTIIAKKSVLVDDHYIRLLIDKANENQEKNSKRIEKFYKKIKELFPS